MKKLIFGVMIAVAGCAFWQNTQGPVVPPGGLWEGNVRIVAQEPSAACTLKGTLLNDTNPTEQGIPLSFFELNAQMRQSLASGAERLGGNTVWLKSTQWENPELSDDYQQSFVVNNVEYAAQVYDCPAR